MEQLFTLQSGNGFTVEVAVSEKTDTLKNTSDITVGLRVKSAYYKNYIYYLSGSVKIDGVALVTMNSTVSTHNVSITATNTYFPVVRSSDSYTDSPWTMVGIVHNTDGSKSVKLELEIRGYTYGGGGSGWSVSTSRTLQLTHIPRASTVGASDANIGAVSTLSVVRRSAAYTHTIAYQFGSLTGYIKADGSVSSDAAQLKETSIPFLLPVSFYGQIPNSPKGTCTLTCRTYQGAAQIGEAQTAKLTVTAPKDACIPSLSGTVVDSSAKTLALTGDKNILVRYASNALCTISVTAKNSASIAEKTIGGVKVTGSTRTIPEIAAGTVAFGCTDSRGYSASVTVEKPLVPYIHLTGNLTVKRTDPTSGRAKLTLTGKAFQGSFGAAENTLTIQYAINGGTAVAITPTFDGDSYTAEADLTGLNYQQSHTITVTVADRLETVTKSAAVGKGIPVFDWGEEDFQFHVPVYVNGTDVAAAAAAANTAAASAQSAAAAAQKTANAAQSTANAAAPKSALTVFEKCAKLYSGSLTSGSITFSGSPYRLFVVVGKTATGGSQTTVAIPREAITAVDTDWMVAGSNYYVSFYLKYSGGTVTLTHKNSSGSGGCITAVYGVA